MFVKAIAKASQYTHPLIISHRLQNGLVESKLGSFVIINEEGWFLTAAHIIEETKKYQEDLKAYHNYLHGNGLTLNPKWIIQHSLWFGADHHSVKEFYTLPNSDIALGKLENYNPQFVKEYPRFISPSAIKIGRTVCKLGFPFYDIQATFKHNAFHYDSKLFPIPMFPLEGMVTRIIPPNQWIETSTPGLRGQSGGPIFDADGKLWGIQSMTRHIPLGFTPSISKDGKVIEENQFINLGWGVHPEVIIKLLNLHQVKYYLSSAN